MISTRTGTAGSDRAAESTCAAHVLHGLDWSQLRAGVRLRVGEALLETTTLAIPCRQNARWFTGGRFGLLRRLRSPLGEAGVVLRRYGET